MHITNYAKDTTVQYVCQDTTAGEAGGENAIDRGQPKKSRNKGKRG